MEVNDNSTPLAFWHLETHYWLQQCVINDEEKKLQIISRNGRQGKLIHNLDNLGIQKMADDCAICDMTQRRTPSLNQGQRPATIEWAYGETVPTRWPPITGGRDECSKPSAESNVREDSNGSFLLIDVPPVPLMWRDVVEVIHVPQPFYLGGHLGLPAGCRCVTGWQCITSCGVAAVPAP